MALRVSLKNLGILKQADFSLGDLTIICGKNNTGKTYATYALFGFLLGWKSFLEVRISNQTTEDLFKDGITRIDVSPYVRRSGQHPETGLRELHRATTENLCFKSGPFQ